MELFILAGIIMICVIIMFIVFEINFKKIKQAGQNEELDKLSQKFPDNKEICETILKKLNNTKVQIKESNEKEASLYIAITNTILIANIKNSYTRIQTIAHECLHSIQNRKVLIFNFIYSNIYILSFVVFTVLALFKIIENKLLFGAILIIMSFIYYMIRSFLEMDAMTKAEFLAKEYMEEYQKKNTEILQEDVEKISNEYKRINTIGVPATQFMLFLNCCMKIIIYLIIAGIVS